ncbi:MAG: undecaprenyl-diphosphate phosphatase [Bdellovibrionota bacterium]
MNIFDASILGIVEGITEYLPISSTGHLILTSKLLGIGEDDATKVFNIAVQLGAIFAVVILYWDYFLAKIKGLVNKEKLAVRFFLNLFVAFLPVAVVGLLFASWIKRVLFSPMWVLAALVVGGLIMILVEKWIKHQHKKPKEIDALTYKDALIVGLCQIASLWPGFSRSMSTILGGRFAGLDAKASTEFSFFLAVPTLGAATCYEMFKALRAGDAVFDSQWWTALGVGLFISFVTAFIVIKVFLVFLRKYPLSVFGYYRIALAGILYFLIR